MVLACVARAPGDVAAEVKQLAGGPTRLVWSRAVVINNASNINGRDVYHPRWSNHPRFLAMTGPGVGGHETNLYLGEFNSEFTKVARWFQVTHDDQGDFYGDVWIGSR